MKGLWEQEKWHISHLRDKAQRARADQLDELLLKVKRQAEKTKAPVSNADFKKLVKEFLGG